VFATAQAHDNDIYYTASRRADNKRAMQLVLDVCEESDSDRNRVHAQTCRIANPISRSMSSRTMIDS
jgi:hypothetical protein